MTFEEMLAINVNEHTENKNGLTYLSWAWAWAEFKKKQPDATYGIKMFDGKPYIYDENLGYMVFTEVTAGGETKVMWLPVMDSANNAMKAEPYTIKGRYKEVEVKAATMFDVNKTIMRCLTKNLAMFGLGLYIYAGEDLPDDLTEEEKKIPAPPAMIKRPKCERCGKELDAIKKSDGSTMLVKEVEKYSKEKFGKCLCGDCMKAASKGAVEK